jgi:putative ABC transport system substrate-binding protein
MLVWPRHPHAQEQRTRRIGVLNGGPDDDVLRAKLGVFRQTLQQAGWTEGGNLELNIRWGSNNAERVVSEARELVRAKPDIILAGPTNAVVPLLRETGNIPVVFVQVSDPVGQRIVQSLARPGGNITGFSNLEFTLVGKWLQTLKEVAPAVARIAMMIHTSNAVSAQLYWQFAAAAPSLGIEAIAAPYTERDDISRITEALAAGRHGALLVPGDSFTDSPPVRAHIIELASRLKLPALHSQREFVASGGLMSYGPDHLDQYRLAATYVDRILKGESPSDLPVQQPTKFNLAVNLKTAKSLGLEIPPKLLFTADEVIE